jgi:lysozyme
MEMTMATIEKVTRRRNRLRVPEDALKLLKQLEGLRLKAYLCPGGVWTIGYGHTKDVQDGDELLDEQEAHELLADDALEFEAVVQKHVKAKLSVLQFSALVIFAFNIGETAFAKSTLVAQLNRGDYAGVPAQLRRWNKVTKNGKKVVSSGLVKRREAEVALWLAGADTLEDHLSVGEEVASGSPASPEKIGRLSVTQLLGGAGAALGSVQAFLATLQPVSWELVALVGVLAAVVGVAVIVRRWEDQKKGRE